MKALFDAFAFVFRRSSTAVMSRVRTRAMRSTSLSSAPVEVEDAGQEEDVSLLTPPPPSSRQEDQKLGDPGPSSRASQRKRQRLDEEEPAVEVDVKIEPAFSDGDAEATEPLSPTITSDMRVKEEHESDMLAPFQEQENSAALQWDDAEAEHAMEADQLKNEETEADESATRDPDAVEEPPHAESDLLGSSERDRLEHEYGLHSSSSYHSEDTDDYELEHRPWEDRPAIKRDIYGIIETMVEIDIESTYKIVDRLGEGTFSSVYLAIDMKYNEYRNDYHHGCLSPRTKRALKKDPMAKVYVALKRIYYTSSPQRIENEIEILEGLRGCRNVSQLITAFRHHDQVIVTMPYHRNDDFRHFYRHMDAEHIASYMLCMFRGLADIHARGIIHRDVKPANFLYNYETQCGVLVDFGLAQRYEPPRKPICQHAPATLESLHGHRVNTKYAPLAEQAAYSARKRGKLGDGKVGFLSNDKRPAIKTNRAGTRGFRAPEVLFKCPDQTVAIDVWSAGIMLLSILTQRFPIFNSNDDIEALMEIAALFGRSAIERCALLHNRTIITNVPTLDEPLDDIATIVLKLNPNLYIPKCSTTPTQAEAEDHIIAMDNALNLVKKCLLLDPTKRITAANALEHPFFDQAVLDQAQRDEDEEMTWGKIEPEEDSWQRIARGMSPPSRPESCQPLHRVIGGKEILDIRGEELFPAFGQGIMDPDTQWCPEHEQDDLCQVWG